ncbi:alpha/beta-hydrolase [Meredithblackwellia eburnea MCA 4105]
MSITHNSYQSEPLSTAPLTEEAWQPSSHLSELVRLATLTKQGGWNATFLRKAKSNVAISLVRYILRAIQDYIQLIIWSPTTLWNPFTSIATFVIYPFIILGLTGFTILFWIMSHLGGYKLAKWASRKWANGYSAPNWLDPTIFGPHSEQVVKSALPFLSGAPTTLPAVPSDNSIGATTRIFPLPLARTFLLFSALVYEREDSLVEVAAEQALRGNLKKAEGILDESERRIRDQCEGRWGLLYEGVSDLSTAGGPFASIFYPRPDSGQPPWIALVFKGTSVDNFAEILVDASITRTSGEVFFGAGSVHEGFFSNLFPENDGGADGYSTIRAHLRSLASRLRSQSPDSPKIPLWITGHSLGSTLASLTFARFLHQPDDLGEDLELRDAFCFGTPRLGDGAWASKFEEACISPMDRPNVLWRVVNHLDVVTAVPPGLADISSNRSMLGLSILNYSHIGVEFRLDPLLQPFYTVHTGYFRTATKLVLEDSDPPHGRGKRHSSRLGSLDSAGWNPLRIAIAMLPAPFYDHFPASYYAHMNLIDAAPAKSVNGVAPSRKKKTK